MPSHPQTLAHKEFRASDRGKALIAQSEADAASFLFDLQSGELNADVAEHFTAHEIYMAVTLAGSLSFEASNTRYTVTPYYQNLNEDDALAMLQDVQATIESSLINLVVESQDNKKEYFPGATKMEIMDICAPDIFGEYDVPEEVEEWQWIENNACFSHGRNGEDGIWEFVLNVSYEFKEIPERLKGVIASARECACGYILIHQGT